MSNQIQTFFADASGSNAYPKLIEGDPAVYGRWVKFELANGRTLSYMPERNRAQTFILRDGENQVARSVRYRDEEGDIRTHVYSYFAREDYPEWKNADQNPHIELDFEVSCYGDLQTVSLQKCLKSFSMDGKRWRKIPPFGDQTPYAGNDDFVLNEQQIIVTLNRFHDYAVGCMLRGNQPDFEQLNALFKEPTIDHGMAHTSDVKTGPFGNFTV